MQNFTLKQTEDWKLLFTAVESSQIILSHRFGGKARVTMSAAAPSNQSYRGKELMTGDTAVPLLVPRDMKVYGRCLNTSTTVTIALDVVPSPTDLANQIGDLKTWTEGALASEATKRNDAIASAVNAEAAARSYVDTQEAQTRLAADNAEATARAKADSDEATARVAVSDRVATLETTRLRKYAANIGNGVLTSFTFMHNFNTTDVLVQVFTTNGIIAPLSVTRTANGVTVTFALALAANSRIEIFG